MTVILINPNSTQAMTQSALDAARAASPDIQFEGWTSHQGPAAIEGAEDGAQAVPPMLKLVKEASDLGADVIIIACFDDTGLAAAQNLAVCPVIGIGQASFALASLLSGQTCVITTVQAAVPVIEHNIQTQGYTSCVSQVIAANVPVLTFETAPDEAIRGFSQAAKTLPSEMKNLILGCSGAVTIKEHMQSDAPYKVIDGVSAAARLCRAFTV